MQQFSLYYIQSLYDCSQFFVVVVVTFQGQLLFDTPQTAEVKLRQSNRLFAYSKLLQLPLFFAINMIIFDKEIDSSKATALFLYLFAVPSHPLTSYLGFVSLKTAIPQKKTLSIHCFSEHLLFTLVEIAMTSASCCTVTQYNAIQNRWKIMKRKRNWHA